MFCNIKNQINNHVVREIMAASVFDNSPDAMDYKANEFRRHESWELYGWVENGEIVGVCGFEVHKDYAEILNIAVTKNARRRGIGNGMVTALQQRYMLTIEAETDDDAVDFYRKCGFETTAIHKYGVRRWVCVLSAPNHTYNSE